MNDIQKARFNDANREDIEQYLAEGGAESGIILTDLQEKLLDRWRYADERIRQNKYNREQIAKFIIGKYTVSRDTAYRDIVNAERVFVSSYPLNKQYISQRRIELLEKMINECRTAGDFANAGSLEKVLQKYVEKYPDAIVPHSPKTIVYKIVQNNVTVNAAASIEEADALLLSSDDVLKNLEEAGDEPS